MLSQFFVVLLERHAASVAVAVQKRDGSEEEGVASSQRLMDLCNKFKVMNGTAVYVL
jgi:hypothetical protein